MNASPPCFVDEVIEPVRLIKTVAKSSDESAGVDVQQFSTLEQVSSYFDHHGSQNRGKCCVSICQLNSWSPLQITKPMFGFLAESFDLDTPVWDLASCFYDKDMDLEEAFCMPFTESRDGPVREISYTIRYPEFKEIEGKWAIRQTGVYHKFNLETHENLFILLNPTPTSKAHLLAEGWVCKDEPDLQKDYFWLHKELFQTHLPAWRLYCAYLEETFVPIANNAVATFIDELSDTEYGHLTELTFLENRFLQMPIILAASRDVLEGLSSLCDEQCHGTDTASARCARMSLFHFKQHRRKCEAYTRVAEYLQQRAQKTTQLLANTLSFREQLGTKSQNESMLHLNKSAVFITTLTLLYLPPSFVATFFGMNFFDLDEESDRIVGTSMIWIYVLCSAALTICTFVLYHLLLDGTLFSQLRGKVPKLRRLIPRRNAEKSSDTGLGSFDV